MAEEYAVSVVPDEEPRGASTLGVGGVIWNELSGGIGPWGTLRPALQPATQQRVRLVRHPTTAESVSGSLAGPLHLVHCGRLVGF